MASSLEKILLTEIGQLYQNADDYNVQIHVGQEPNIQIFRAHSVILRARSAYFRAALSENWAKTDGNMITLRKPNISPTVFEVILKYIYTGDIPLNETSIRINYILLLIAADELALIDLIDHIQTHIIKKEPELLRRNLVEFLQVSSRHEACRPLQSYCEDIVCQSPDEFFKLEAFASLDQYIFVNLLEKVFFNMKEVEIWENVIRWGIAQNPRLGHDISKWTPNDFLDLKESIAACIPHIRFFNISGPEYYKKIWPYRKVLPKDLKNDLIKFHVGKEFPQIAESISPRIFVDSNIIGGKYFEQLASWIDREQEPYPFKKNPYEFRLLMRGDRDGLYNIKEFQRRCGKKGPTIIIIKVAGSKRLIGGYNPVEWCSSKGYISSRDSFIFSFDNNTLNNSILSRVKNPDCAIFNSDNAYIGFGSDLEWFSGYCEQYNYREKILNQSDFVMENFEVFQVIRRPVP